MSIVGTVHDELIGMCLETDAAFGEKVMYAAMVQAPKWAIGIPLACEVHTGSNYYDAK
jgi:DNA polymerase I-like protein with 3'-5' exonuclease and polymerase domains